MTKLILASASISRFNMMQNAGLKFEVIPANVDERLLETANLHLNQSPDEIALMLAEKKSQTVSSSRKTELIIGADQVLSMDGKIFHKPSGYDEAKIQLEKLSGNIHTLHSAVACVQNGQTVWKHVAKAHLYMRNFSSRFIKNYLHAVDDGVLRNVGCYQLEGLGIQLFEKIDGDFFTILGLPMLQLLAFLRKQGVIES